MTIHDLHAFVVGPHSLEVNLSAWPIIVGNIPKSAPTHQDSQISREIANSSSLKDLWITCAKVGGKRGSND
jgi:hypothetical protein